jgi:hypothetical protein
VATAGVDFFRVDRSGATKRLLIVAGTLVAVGATSIGAHLVRRLGPSLGRLVSLLGGLTVVAGLILGFGAMAMLLFENVYLLLREDGVLCHENGKETVVAWSDLEDVTLEEATGVVVFQRKGAAPLRWYAGANAKELHGKVEGARRKVLHGIPTVLSRPLS